MNLVDELSKFKTIFIDTAPIIYYIEAHSQFGPLVKNVINLFRSGRLIAFSSVITLTEVLPKPVEAGNEVLVKKFLEFFKHGKNLNLLEINTRMAEKAGKLRGKYPGLKTIDAIQLSGAIEIGAHVFLTNDKKLGQVKEIKVFVLKDFTE